MTKPRQGPTPVGQRNRASTIPGKRIDGPTVGEWEEEYDPYLNDTYEYRRALRTGEWAMNTCLNCDKPIDHPGYCSNLCEDMDAHPAPRDDMERFTK